MCKNFKILVMYITNEELVVLMMRVIEKAKKFHEKDPIFDETDLAILKNLVRNPRMSFKEIAKDVGVTRVTVRNRLKKLFEREIISLRVLFNAKKFDLKFAILCLSFYEYSHVNKCLNIALHCPKVLMALKSVGKYHVVLTIVESDERRLQKVIDEFQYLPGVKESLVLPLSTTNILKPVFFDVIPSRILLEMLDKEICRMCPINSEWMDR